MKLDKKLLTNPEVHQWQGLNLLHFKMSSCSQKVRIFLNEKKLSYRSHEINLAKQEHTRSWFLGINPRGVVPVLVDNGDVHIESNDILQYLDTLPSDGRCLFPQNPEDREFVQQSLALEDSLHIDLRNLTMGFIFPKRLVQKSPQVIKQYREQGCADPHRSREADWWENFASQGIPDETALRSFSAFKAAFLTLESRLSKHPWLLEGGLSVLDISWYISVHRLKTAGYPLDLHPKLNAWYKNLHRRDGFHKEVNGGFFIECIVTPLYRQYRKFTGRTLIQLMKKQGALA